MPRFLLPADCWSDAALRGDEAKHLVQVLRIKAGETVTVFDGQGRRATARVLACQRDHVLLDIGEAEMPEPPKPRITLALAIPKGKNMDLIVQKAVELGVAKIQPLITRHTIVQPGEGKADKWRRTALEACKQCGQDTLPEIAEARDFVRWIADPQPAQLKLIASLAAGSRPFRETLLAHPEVRECTLLIGPEGDFSAEETQAALAAGYLPISLGRIVLRVETAAFYALSALRYAYS